VSYSRQRHHRETRFERVGYPLETLGALPVSVSEMKSHLRIAESYTADDAQIEVYTRAAVDYVQQSTGRQIVATLMRADFYDWWSLLDYSLNLYPAPGISVDEIRYRDADNVQQTLSTDVYEVDTASRAAMRVWLAHDQSWPMITNQPQAIEIDYYAGHFIEATELNPVTNEITLTVPLAEGTRVNLHNTDGDLSGNLNEYSTYYVLGGGTTIQLSSTEGGNPVAFTGATGTTFLCPSAKPELCLSAIKIIAAGLYHMRTDVVTGTIVQRDVGIDRLLAQCRVTTLMQEQVY
jgi:uncharacterized phiE125 gp8 family phage protein